MKITSVRIQNLRSFLDETILMDKYTCLVGPNGSGKSTILCALNIFFRENESAPTDLYQLDREDFHHGNIKEPIKITVTFTELNEEAQNDFSDYFRQGQLVVSAIATFDEATGKAEVKQYGQRLGMEDFMEFFGASGDNKLVSELKDIYKIIREKYPDLPAPGTKKAMTDALRSYETAKPEKLILLQSGDQFYGFSKGTNRLRKHVQWVFVPAVKDATTEQIEARNTALGNLLSRTVRSKTNFDDSISTLRTQTRDQYQDLLNNNQNVLDEISGTLQSRLSEWAHPDATLKLQWKQDPEKSVQVAEPWAHIIAGDGDFEGELARCGHGFQRSYLLALLQELASIDGVAGPKLILACEEPELYQHPPQARHLAQVLQKLSTVDSQIIISTHSPLFVSGDGFENVRMVQKDESNKLSTVSHMTYTNISEEFAQAMGEAPNKLEGTLAKIHQALQPSINEIFFTRRLILVEGLEDVAYISAYLNLMEQWEEFRRAGCHFVPVNGKSELLQPLIIAKHMTIPTYVVFDADADKPDNGGRQAKHEKDNKAILTVLGKSQENPLPKETLWGTNFTMWHSDIGSVVQADIGETDWNTSRAEADRIYGPTGGLRKNTLHIGASLAFAWKAGKRSTNLERLCGEIIKGKNSV